jgi:hypothetical protein
MLLGMAESNYLFNPKETTKVTAVTLKRVELAVPPKIQVEWVPTEGLPNGAGRPSGVWLTAAGWQYASVYGVVNDPA